MICHVDFFQIIKVRGSTYIVPCTHTVLCKFNLLQVEIHSMYLSDVPVHVHTMYMHVLCMCVVGTSIKASIHLATLLLATVVTRL